MERLKVVEQELADFKIGYSILERALRNREEAISADSSLLVNRKDRIDNLQGQVINMTTQRDNKQVVIDGLQAALQKQKALTWKVAGATIGIASLVLILVK